METGESWGLAGCQHSSTSERDSASRVESHRVGHLMTRLQEHIGVCTGIYTQVYTNTHTQLTNMRRRRQQQLCVVGLGMAMFEMELDIENLCNNRSRDGRYTCMVCVCMHVCMCVCACVCAQMCCAVCVCVCNSAHPTSQCVLISFLPTPFLSVTQSGLHSLIVSIMKEKGYFPSFGMLV
jgi:hypothetical protein